jgi:O-acetylserine/cysteine efflux transporter
MAPQHLLLMLLVCATWGFNFVAGKVGVAQLPPVFFTGLRFLILAVLLIPFLKVAHGRMRDVVLIGLFNGAIQFALLFVGVSLTAASVVAVVVQLGVPFATILSIFWLGEVVRWRRWFGMGMTFAGVMVVSFDPHVFDSPAGVLFAAAGALSGAVASILMRRLAGVGMFQLQAWTAVVSAPLLLAVSFIVESDPLGKVSSVDSLGWGALAFTVLGSSLVGHTGYYYLLQRYEVSLIAPLSLLAPILGVVFGVWLLSEPLTSRLLIGAAIAFAGVGVLAVRGKLPVETAT